MKNTTVHPELLAHIANIGSKALWDKETQKMLSEEGFSSAKAMASSAVLSLIAKGDNTVLHAPTARIAAEALNDTEAQERLNKTHGFDTLDCTIASITFFRISENDFDAVPESLSVYRQAVEAMRSEDYEHPSFRNLAG